MWQGWKSKKNLQSHLESLLKIDDYIVAGKGLPDDTVAVGVVVVPARQPDIIQPASRLVQQAEPVQSPLQTSFLTTKNGGT